MTRKRLKNRYIEGFGITVLILALVRCIFPGVAGLETEGMKQTATDVSADSIVQEVQEAQLVQEAQEQEVQEAQLVQEDLSPTRYLADGQRPHRIYSVPSYEAAFPDSNHVQLAAAEKWGVKPVKDRKDAEMRKDELVFIDYSPYYHVDYLSHSIPYLVPRASVLLYDIGRNFFDSLQVKGLPLHRIIVTSVLRTEEDVRRLRRTNKNATEQSCHLFGTTLDISYTRFETVSPPNGARRRAVSDDTLKFVLSEVLNDLRQQGRCYVKYERKQSCFHLTVR